MIDRRRRTRPFAIPVGKRAHTVDDAVPLRTAVIHIGFEGSGACAVVAGYGQHVTHVFLPDGGVDDLHMAEIRRTIAIGAAIGPFFIAECPDAVETGEDFDDRIVPVVIGANLLAFGIFARLIAIIIGKRQRIGRGRLRHRDGITLARRSAAIECRSALNENQQCGGGEQGRACGRKRRHIQFGHDESYDFKRTKAGDAVFRAPRHQV